MTSLDSFKCRKILKVGNKSYVHYSRPAAEKNGLRGISRLPFSLKVLLENMLRHEDGRSDTKEDIQGSADWLKTKTSEREVPLSPARVLMQDFTGVPAVVDLAAMRDAMKNLGGDPRKITRSCRSISSSTTRSSSTSSATRRPSPATWSWSTSATASATSSSSGASSPSRTSPSCRPAPAS